MINFTGLPIEIQQMIFLNLPISDALHRCKLVCKGWKDVIDLMRYTSLSIVKKYPFKEGYDVRSRDHYDLIATNFRINLKSADFLPQLHQLAIIEKVKKMTTVFSNFPDFKILTNFYNQFVYLEDLTLHF